MDQDEQAREGIHGLPPRPDRPLNITVLMGGPSAERDVSLLSGEAVANALETAGHTVWREDIAPLNTTALDREGIDVVFIALHGEFGESGEVQELCRQRRLRYIGSGPRAGKLAMDKAAAKQIFKTVGLRTPDWMVLEQFHKPAMVREWLEQLPPPVVCKPVDGGSSVNVTIARDEGERDEAIGDLLDLHGRAMLERFVPGRELTVGILGDDLALPVLEVQPDGTFYDYRAKYSDDATTRYCFQTGLDESLTAMLQEQALEAHHSLGCRDLSRVDFILDEHNTPWVLEVNTIPGFTSHSLLPKAAAEIGIDFVTLVDTIVAMAMQREP
ncbi:MAG: D-alanine--D-alanine ligase [Phycisphaerae bacterium]